MAVNLHFCLGTYLALLRSNGTSDLRGSGSTITTQISAEENRQQFLWRFGGEQSYYNVFCKMPDQQCRKVTYELATLEETGLCMTRAGWMKVTPAAHEIVVLAEAALTKGGGKDTIQCPLQL